MRDEIRVLHVDDDPAFTDVSSTILEGEDERFSVETAGDADEALARLDDGAFDCVVSDYEMPGPSGIELLETVRATDPDIPFLLFTGKGSEDLASEAISAGVTDYIQKRGTSDQYTVLANRIDNAVTTYRMEQELDATRRQFKKIVEQNLVGIYIIQDQEFVYVNPKLAEIHGYERTTVIGMSPLDLIAPAERDRVRRNLAKRTGGEVSDIQYETVGLTSDGEHIDIELHGSSITYEGNPAVIGAELDISERKARERELERYETVLAATGDPVYTLDDDGDITTVNRALVELTGYDEDALVGEHASKILPPDAIEKGRAAVRALLRSGEERDTIEIDVVTADGERIPVENHFSKLPSESGFRGTVSALRDISDRVERERRLQRERDRLDEFAGVVSHDLRNPLNVATSRLELVAQDCDSEHIEHVDTALDRIDTIIDDVLSLAQVGQTVGATEAVDLSDLATGCWGTVVTDGADIDVRTEATIQADETRLKQLLENLFRNAVEHGEGVTVTVGDLDDGFYVADDGPGIPAADRETVFEVGHSTVVDGTGFGLSIVREIAEAHGWDVAVTDSESGGARFEIRGTGD
jgi:PAS domain S-box-containing protein